MSGQDAFDKVGERSETHRFLRDHPWVSFRLSTRRQSDPPPRTLHFGVTHQHLSLFPGYSGRLLAEEGVQAS